MNAGRILILPRRGRRSGGILLRNGAGWTDGNVLVRDGRWACFLLFVEAVDRQGRRQRGYGVGGAVRWDRSRECDGSHVSEEGAFEAGQALARDPVALVLFLPLPRRMCL